MATLPQRLRRLHLFKNGEDFFAADLELCRTVQLSPGAWQYLAALGTNGSVEETRRELSSHFTAEEIEVAIEELHAVSQRRLLFDLNDWTTEWKAAQASTRPRFFIPQEVSMWFPEIDRLAAGTNIALHHTVRNLARWADIHFAGYQFRQLDEGIFETPLPCSEALSAPWRLEQAGYFGILALQDYQHDEILAFFRQVELPILLLLYVPRGHGGSAINSILQHYATMRPFDAFAVLSQPVIDFYQRFVLDTDAFFTLPGGFEAELFRPSDKIAAKQEIAARVKDSRLTQQPVVGYLSRFQMEKGGSVFLKTAVTMPDVLFLIGGRMIDYYQKRRLPKNVVYAGFLPREKLPVLYNAFDIYCFPTLSGEETFGLTLLEAMACGVPAVVPNWDGMPEVVGDVGILVDAQPFEADIGSFATAVSPDALADGVRQLLADETLRRQLGQKARQRALELSWEKTAKRIVEIFHELHRRKRRFEPNRYWTRFVPKLNPVKGVVEPEAALLNLMDSWEIPLMRSGYSQTLIEGLALSLARRHTPHEVEAVLWHLCENRQEVERILHRVWGFIEATA